MNKTIIFFVLIGIILLSLFGFYSYSSNENKNIGAVIYKTSSCGCCGLYSTYMQRQGFNVEVVTQSDISNIKEKQNIPSHLQSCHTTIVDNYFVEGHMPIEAIEKLITEKPDIAGIAMPGMPSGSPGMPGAKTGDFVIHAVNKDGSFYEFMRI